MMNRIKTQIEIDRIRISGRILATVLDRLEQDIRPGMTTMDLDMIARKELKGLGGNAPFLGYVPGAGTPPFPGVICISVNDEIVHGIPGSRVIESGDIVGLDFGVEYKGMITDGARTLAVGNVTTATQRLLNATSQALSRGIAQAVAGNRVGDISNAIETRLRADKLGIVRELSGHGVGHELHEDPLILNYGKAGRGHILQAGMTIAIEPMASLGRSEIVIDDDDWTIRTSDGSLAAQFEHTILITDGEPEILTVSN
jgi:methionyl aminopeptidase